MSSLERPPAAVRMMTPPVKPCCSRNSRTMPRSRAALFARLDLARDADVVDRRHEDQEPARHRDVRGQAGALGAERLLDHLDEDFLPFLQQVFDLGFGRSRSSRDPPRDVAAVGSRSPAPPRSRPRRRACRSAGPPRRALRLRPAARPPQPPPPRASALTSAGVPVATARRPRRHPTRGARTPRRC